MEMTFENKDSNTLVRIVMLDTGKVVACIDTERDSAMMMNFDNMDKFSAFMREYRDGDWAVKF